MTDDAAALRARLNDELGFYPASLDPASIAEYRRKAAEEDDGSWRPEVTVTAEQRKINARKKKAERGWIVEPPQPHPGLSPGEEIDRWYRVIGIRGRTA